MTTIVPFVQTFDRHSFIYASTRCFETQPNYGMWGHETFCVKLNSTDVLFVVFIFFLSGTFSKSDVFFKAIHLERSPETKFKGEGASKT